MTAPRELPDWPTLLSEGDAAAYLSVSASTLRKHVGVKPVKIGRRKLFRRSDLDQFVDGLAQCNSMSEEEWLNLLNEDKGARG